MSNPDLDRYLATPVEATMKERPSFAGIIGDRPSQYARSPSLWNATFKALAVDAVYVPFDVDAPNLKPLIEELRGCRNLLGLNVTVPYKMDIVPLLDEVETRARRIGAVNTVTRTPEGSLIGYNTDGQGAIDSLTRTMPGQAPPFMNSLAGLTVILLGAGGSARAVVFFLAEALGPKGRLFILNRDGQKAKELAWAVTDAHGNATAVDESALEGALEETDLLINATTKGQSGLRALPGERVTCLEPYSALGPADSPAVGKERFATPREFYAQWFPVARGGILKNLEISFDRIVRLKEGAGIFDLVYSPQETLLLRQGRLSGHPTINGKGMNIWQAVDAFGKVMKGRLPGDPAALETRVFTAMSSVG